MVFLFIEHNFLMKKSKKSLDPGATITSSWVRLHLDVSTIEYGIEKSRAVLFSDFVTVLGGAPMQYITKLATSQSQKSRSPLSQNII